VDIFPDMNLPVIYISHPFGGYTPTQMEAFFGKQYVNLLLYVSGVKSIETKNIQGLTLMKLTFIKVQIWRKLPPKYRRLVTVLKPYFLLAQPPFILRFDASTLPVGQLVLSSDVRSNNELLDLANTYIRSSFTSIPGLMAPPPFGGNIRTVVIKADPELMRAHNITPDQIVEAIRLNNQTSPSGNVRIGDVNYITPVNTTIKKIEDFQDIPIFKGGCQLVFA
jgi:multidrug efflux pump subunit AcrB